MTNKCVSEESERIFLCVCEREVRNCSLNTVASNIRGNAPYALSSTVLHLNSRHMH